MWWARFRSAVPELRDRLRGLTGSLQAARHSGASTRDTAVRRAPLEMAIMNGGKAFPESLLDALALTRQLRQQTRTGVPDLKPDCGPPRRLDRRSKARLPGRR